MVFITLGLFFSLTLASIIRAEPELYATDPSLSNTKDFCRGSLSVDIAKFCVPALSNPAGITILNSGSLKPTEDTVALILEGTSTWVEPEVE